MDIVVITAKCYAQRLDGVQVIVDVRTQLLPRTSKSVLEPLYRKVLISDVTVVVIERYITSETRHSHRHAQYMSIATNKTRTHVQEIRIISLCVKGNQLLISQIR